MSRFGKSTRKCAPEIRTPERWRSFGANPHSLKCNGNSGQPRRLVHRKNKSLRLLFDYRPCLSVADFSSVTDCNSLAAQSREPGIESGIANVRTFSPFPTRTKMRLKLLAAGNTHGDKSGRG